LIIYLELLIIYLNIILNLIELITF